MNASCVRMDEGFSEIEGPEREVARITKRLEAIN